MKDMLCVRGWDEIENMLKKDMKRMKDEKLMILGGQPGYHVGCGVFFFLF